MKNLPILFFTFLLFLFFSCEIPKEKTTIEEEETYVDSTKSIIKEPVSIEYIYKLYGCLNKDNLIPDGENIFILKHKSNYFDLFWECNNGKCGLKNFSCYDLYNPNSYFNTPSYKPRIPREG